MTARTRTPRAPESHTFLNLDEDRVKPKLTVMLMPANPPETPDYVKPEISDYGDLAELTAGFSFRGQSDALWPVPRRDWTFSTP